MLRYRLPLIIVFGAIFFVVSTYSFTSAAQDANQARWIHAQLNEWRLGLELGPLAYNSTLEAMAIAQAEYLNSMRQWPNDPHAGRNGEGPRIRARWEPYNWPAYGNGQQIVIGEIIWRGTREDAIAFWQSSMVHRNTVTNPRYREVGVAALPIRRGYIFVAVLGARPNVLPALADPYTDTLYLSNDEYDRGVGNWIRHVDQIRLFDSGGSPLSEDWMPFQTKFELPDGVGDSLYVLYSDGDDEAVTRVSLLERDVPLPEYEGAWQPTIEAVPTEILPTPTPTPAPIPHIVIVYDSRSLTLYNSAQSFANVTSLELVSGNFVQPVSELNAAHIRGSFRALPTMNCLHITSIGPRAVPPPSQCRYASTTTVLSSQLFWTINDFQVLRDGTLVAECRRADGICEFDLP